MSKLNQQQKNTFTEAAKKIILKGKTPVLFAKIKTIKTKENVFAFALEAVKKNIDGQAAYLIAKSVLTQREIDTFAMETSAISDTQISDFQKKVSVMLHHNSDVKLLSEALALKEKAEIYLFAAKNLTDRFGAHSSYELMSIVMTGDEMKGFFLSSDQAHHPVVGYAIANRKISKAA